MNNDGFAAHPAGPAPGHGGGPLGMRVPAMAQPFSGGSSFEMGRAAPNMAPAGMHPSPMPAAPSPAYHPPAPASPNPGHAAPDRPRRVTPVAPAAFPVAPHHNAGPAALYQPAPPMHAPAQGPVPGAPTAIPVTPRPLGIAAGLFLIAIGIWALVSFLPGIKLAAAGNLAVPEFRQELYYAGHVAAVALLAIGLLVALGSALYRAQTEVLCRTCHAQVIGWKSSFGLLCPLEKHYARIHWFGIVTTALFWLFALGFLAVLLALPFV